MASLNLERHTLGGIDSSYWGWEYDDSNGALLAEDELDPPDMQSALLAADAFVGSGWYQIDWPEPTRGEAIPPPFWAADALRLTERVESARAGMVSAVPPRVHVLREVYIVGWGSASQPWREHVHAGSTDARAEYSWRVELCAAGMGRARGHEVGRRNRLLTAAAVTIVHHAWNQEWGMYLVSWGETCSWAPGTGMVRRRLGPSRPLAGTGPLSASLLSA